MVGPINDTIVTKLQMEIFFLVIEGFESLKNSNDKKNHTTAFQLNISLVILYK